MLSGFEKWWQEQGRSLDPDTEDVPWFDKREALAHIAFDEGIRIGMAQAGNYVANDSVNPTRIEFANGRTVYVANGEVDSYLGVGYKAEEWQ